MHSKIFLVIIASDPAYGGVFCELHLSLFCALKTSRAKKADPARGPFLDVSEKFLLCK